MKKSCLKILFFSFFFITLSGISEKMQAQALIVNITNYRFHDCDYQLSHKWFHPVYNQEVTTVLDEFTLSTAYLIPGTYGGVSPSYYSKSFNLFDCPRVLWIKSEDRRASFISLPSGNHTVDITIKGNGFIDMVSTPR